MVDVNDNQQNTTSNPNNISSTPNETIATPNSKLSEQKQKTNKSKKEDTSQRNKQIATYVNQWRLKTCYNKSFNLEFFYNNGVLTGNDLMFQLFHILTFCNTVGCRIFGLASDAGGNNARLFSLLCHTKNYLMSQV